ncbi:MULTISPECIES: flagellar motor switch protein FliG [Methylomonas]|uniref:Flagellar motor switch protein FliG n=1 Tax=Methylomonas koyamae TaxID=702114 RepID=A0A177PHU0_9GAMM|nr:MULTISPECIES: flagellar motor switch protein FliG [Methylomonas]ANE56042.1 flagellar motor switch protein FliG [Methylomonas sp. DH-1]ATG90918.1 flagellar motor switch protein FliG [Methylomonas koyamae]OAI12395.1 flagellar motor switch protein FliG [Methylomonas koyamae]OAI28969.1 flagellar motor switch protein FliG [Methylomonas koyamae]WNB77540.1 flagellar motor switch protein FliG [Methylomonas koyamae]
MAEDDKFNKAQRASLLLLAVGQDRAASVLRHMGPKEVQLVGSTMAQLGSITSSMIDQVLEEFIIEIKNETGLGLDSDEYIRNMLTNALGADKAGSIIDRILLGANSKGIEQLKWMDTRAIADLIRLEHPQIISIILSLLDADQAADVLTLLPENMRSDILMRIATLEGVQPAALRELDDIMEKQLTGSEGVKSSQIGGIDAAANILNFIESGISDPMMQDINEINADLGQRIQDKMFVFGDLINVDDRGIQTLLREVSTDQLLLALRGVEAALRDKVFANMSRRAAEMLRDDLEAAPPARLSEVEAAQKDILAIAKRLADAGELSLGGGGGDEFV